MKLPKKINNYVDGKDYESLNPDQIANINPSNGSVICMFPRSSQEDIEKAVKSSKKAYHDWRKIPPVKRGEILYKFCNVMEKQREEIAEIAALETGKIFSHALGETEGAIACGRFFAAEGQRLYGRTAPSGFKNKFSHSVRQPLGIAGLIVPANTPIANIAWKLFPALICGNSVILKPSEDSPLVAWKIGKIAQEVNLPAGVLNILHGFGEEVGVEIVNSKEIGVISFTGSTSVGKFIAEQCGKRLAKVSLELGGKNPMIICDDANIDNAIKWISASAFSNAGQRCSSGTRIIIFEKIYEKVRELLVEKVKNLKLGISEEDDLGPVINEKQLIRMEQAIVKAEQEGAMVLIGGTRAKEAHLKDGFFMKPTLIENADNHADISTDELFGPITVLYKVFNFTDAMKLANDSPYALTAAIHTRNINRAIHFMDNIEAGLANVNMGTFGSEPHMPFGGGRDSGNGTREPGTESLDVYSELKTINLMMNPDDLG